MKQEFKFSTDLCHGTYKFLLKVFQWGFGEIRNRIGISFNLNNWMVRNCSLNEINHANEWCIRIWSRDQHPLPRRILQAATCWISGNKNMPRIRYLMNELSGDKILTQVDNNTAEADNEEYTS